MKAFHYTLPSDEPPPARRWPWAAQVVLAFIAGSAIGGSVIAPLWSSRTLKPSEALELAENGKAASERRRTAYRALAILRRRILAVFERRGLEATPEGDDARAHVLNGAREHVGSLKRFRKHSSRQAQAEVARYLKLVEEDCEAR